jgi:Reverse transcriptase (RNA-dependent DNA polymerase)
VTTNKKIIGNWEDNLFESDDLDHSDEDEPQMEVRRSTRTLQPSTRLRDYVTYSIKYLIANYISYENISCQHRAYLTSISKEQEPNSYHEAILCSNWQEAMKEELNALEKNNTWIIVQLPKNKKSVGCKWVYRIKYNSDDTIERYKARLVAKGYTQIYGLDYYEIFALVAKMNTVRILFSIAINHKWSLYQMDVKNVFLQGTLEEEVYMNLPPGHKQEGNPNLVCKLERSIYGLK